jgi:hypothetical protein
MTTFEEAFLNIMMSERSKPMPDIFEPCRFGTRVSTCYHNPRCERLVPGDKHSLFGKWVSASKAQHYKVRPGIPGKDNIHPYTLKGIGTAFTEAQFASGTDGPQEVIKVADGKETVIRRYEHQTEVALLR